MRVSELAVDRELELLLGDPHGGAQLLLSPVPGPVGELADEITGAPSGGAVAPGGSARSSPTPNEGSAAGLRVNGRDVKQPARLTVGRHERSDIHVDHPKVSREHGILENEPSGWIYRDTSRRGTFRDGGRVSQVLVDREMELMLGDPKDGAVLQLSPLRPQQAPRPKRRDQLDPSRLGKLSAVHQWHRERVRVGRAADNDIVLTDLRVSRHHAELARQPDGGFEIADLKSHNGTFVNGRRVERARLADHDIVAIGSHVFRFLTGRLEEYDDRGEAWLLATNLSAWSDGQQLLSDVSLALPPSSLLAVVGPSGAGKTSLLNALTGFRPAQSGSVLYAGRDVYAAYDDVRQRMGFVPQGDIVHAELTVRRGLQFAAELRFPPDVEASARTARVDEVMLELGLTQRADVRVEQLSGGQRKRASIGLELLTKPSLLFLDEPTSGLDPANEEQVVALLRALASAGRIVVVATHSVETLKQCDRVLFLAPGGRPAFFGPPHEALQYFGRYYGATDFPDVFRKLLDAPGSRWSQQFEQDSAHAKYVAQPLARLQLPRSGRPPRIPPHQPKHTWAWQLQVLVRRYLAILASDRRNLALMGLQAPFLGVLIVLMFGADKLSCRTAPEATMLLWLLVVGATWLGASNSVREIVKELPIYRRERSVGLSISAYLSSKVAVLAAITVVQTAVLVLTGLSTQQLHANVSVEDECARMTAGTESAALVGSPHLELVVGIGLAGIASMAFALLASALVTRADKASTLLPYILIVQTVVSQPFFPAAAPPLEVLRYVTSAHWGMSAAAATVDLNRLRSSYLLGTDVVHEALGSGALPTEPQLADAEEQARRGGYRARGEWRQEPSVWLTNVAALLTLTMIFLVSSWAALRRRDRVLPGGRERRRSLRGALPAQPKAVP